MAAVRLAPEAVHHHGDPFHLDGLRPLAITELDSPHLRGRRRLSRRSHLTWPLIGHQCVGIRWESVREHRGNVGIGLGPEGRDRIQFAANLDVKVSGGDRGQEFSFAFVLTLHPLTPRSANSSIASAASSSARNADGGTGSPALGRLRERSDAARRPRDGQRVQAIPDRDPDRAARRRRPARRIPGGAADDGDCGPDEARGRRRVVRTRTKPGRSPKNERGGARPPLVNQCWNWRARRDLNPRPLD